MGHPCISRIIPIAMNNPIARVPQNGSFIEWKIISKNR